MPSPFPPGSLQPEKRPSVVQRAKKPTIWTVIGVVLGAAVQYLLASHGVPAPIVNAASKAVQHAAEQQAAPQNP